jgi:hypothetical protein
MKTKATSAGYLVKKEGLKAAAYINGKPAS